MYWCLFVNVPVKRSLIVAKHSKDVIAKGNVIKQSALIN